MRIGCDLVQVQRIERLVNNEAFVTRLFHPTEIAYCRSQAHSAQAFAARFAAREAFGKALGTGIMAEGISLTDVWVDREESGRPFLRMGDHVLAKLKDAGFSGHDLSLSHQSDYAMAVVVLF